MNKYGVWLTIAALCGGVPIAYAQLTFGIETIPCPLAFETSSVGGQVPFPQPTLIRTAIVPELPPTLR
jgi:hypothetical protein